MTRKKNAGRTLRPRSRASAQAHEVERINAAAQQLNAEAADVMEYQASGAEAQAQKEKAFFQLAERFRAASDPEQVKQLGDQLGRFVSGE